MTARTHGRHAAQPSHNHITTAITKTIAWMITDHDDTTPSRIQALLWFAAFLTLFVCIAVQP